MPINEVFAKPTVKSVFFEVRFPNLFFLEQKIGDLQLMLLETFPESSLKFRRQIVFADVAPGEPLPDFQPSGEEGQGKKVWQFSSPRNFSLDVMTNAMVLTSTLHKSYQLGEADKFRDIIKLAVDALLAIVKIPLFQRIGIRYLDEGPIQPRTSEALRRYYRSTFPLDRFPLEDAREMSFTTVVKKGQSSLRYAESVTFVDNDSCRLVMDFDGYRERVATTDYLTVTDGLHELISDAFDATITDELKRFMRDAAPERG